MRERLRRFRALIPSARVELAEYRRLLQRLDRVHRRAKQGYLDEKALLSIYKALPRHFMHRGGGPAKDILPKTEKLIVELNRIIKYIPDTKKRR